MTLESVYANMTKSLPNLSTAHTENVNLWCLWQEWCGAARQCNECVTGRKKKLPFFLIAHKYVLNLHCVNSSPAKIPTTRKSPWELSTQCRHFIYTEYTSGVTSASCVICSDGINSVICTIHIVNRSPPMENIWIEFFGGWIFTSSESHLLQQKMEEIQKCFRCFTASFTSSKIASLHIQ